MIVFHRSGGMRMPMFDESLQIGDDGTFSMWRSVAWASAMPSPVGRFGGNLTTDQRREIEVAAGAVAAEGSRGWPIRPDSPVDRVHFGGLEAELGIHNQAEGSWAALVAVLRRLLKDLTASPLAGLALEAARPSGPQLVHLGSEELAVDVPTLSVEALHWRGSDSLGQWKGRIADAELVRAGPGWKLALPFDHGFELEAGDRVSVKATVIVTDGDRRVPVALQADDASAGSLHEII